MVLEKRPLKVFLCHASGDKPPVRELYKRLSAEGVDAWLDQEKLLPGQDWRMEIPCAVREADVVVICLSKRSITKEGYVQKEIKFALDIAEEKPEGTIFLIPARLEDCSVPERLNRWQWVDLYEENGFIKLLRSLKLRADAVDASVEPALYVDSAKETDRRLEQWYTEGLAAFYTEDWDRACQRFQSILSERPNHRNAAEKLAESERQRELSKLYEQASAEVRSEDWESAIRILEELSHKSAEYKDSAQLLQDVRKRKQLRDLYTEAKALHTAEKWEAVVRVFAQIGIIEPNYPDAEGLLPSAQKEVAELKRLADLNEQYSRALREMDAGDWYEARRLLETVHKSQTGFLETEKLLKKVEDQIAREEQKRKQNDQVNTLYEQAHGLLRSKKWRNALDKMEEIRKLDEHFPDVDGIAEKAQKELAREEQEADRQNKLAALYAEAVKLLKEEKYQEALDKWGEVRAVDPKYPDRQWVGRTAKRKLGGASLHREGPQQLFWVQRINTRWLILAAAIGFGLARFVQQNLGVLIHTNIPLEIGWSLRGALHGIITALVLERVLSEQRWRALVTFGICGAVFYPTALWAVREQSILPLFALAPVTSIILSSLWKKQWENWQTYGLIFAGWVAAWIIGQSAVDYLYPVFHGASIRWTICDALAGGIGLWVTIDLLKFRSMETPLKDTRGAGTVTPGSANLLLIAFLSVVILRAIWGFFLIKFAIWGPNSPIILKFGSNFVLGGIYGAIVSLAFGKVIVTWQLKQTAIIIMGWALGLGTAVLAEQVSLDPVAGIMALCGISVVLAMIWSDPFIPPLKIILIFFFWALAWYFGYMLGMYEKSNFKTDYAWCFAHAITILLGLMATLGIYEYSSNRLVMLTFISAIGFTFGTYISHAWIGLIPARPDIKVPLSFLLWGFLAGSVFEFRSRNLKKILITGGLCAIGLIIGYYSAELVMSRFIYLRNMLWGAWLGIAFGLSTRRISNIILLSILGSAMFTITAIYISRLPMAYNVGLILRGALIGSVLGFGYAYITRNTEKVN